MSFRKRGRRWRGEPTLPFWGGKSQSGVRARRGEGRGRTLKVDDDGFPSFITQGLPPSITRGLPPSEEVSA